MSIAPNQDGDVSPADPLPGAAPATAPPGGPSGASSRDTTTAKRRARDVFAPVLRPVWGRAVSAWHGGINRIAARLQLRKRSADRVGRYRLFTGAAIDATANDSLEHTAIASALAAAIRDTPASEPLGIALYGAWGQGKSTIGGLLKGLLGEEISSGRYVFVRIDAWKYAHEGERQPLRRHFLISAYEAAGLNRKARELKRLFGAEFTGSLARSRSPLRQSFRATLVELIFVLGLSVAALAAISDLGHGAHWLKRWAHILEVAGFATAFTTVLFGVARDRFRITAKVDPFGSVEEYEDQLTQLITTDARTTDRRPVERFIFFIDDLDRCRDNLVVEAIDTLQAFFGRPNCVYIVAADREQLRRAVRSLSAAPAASTVRATAIGADESFLEKIFQVAVEIPPPMPSTLDEYARELWEESELAAGSDDGSADPLLPLAERDVVLDALVHAEVRSPRQVKVILNEFLMALNVARQRERAPGAHLTHLPLTSRKALLAKLTVLRVHYPWFYALLLARPALLQTVEFRIELLVMRSPVPEETERAWSTVRDAALNAAGEQWLPNNDDEGNEATSPDEARRQALVGEQLLDSLEGYLFRTSETSSTDLVEIEEFIYLRGGEEFENLPGDVGAQYRRAILQGETRLIDQLAKSNPELLSAALDAALSQVETTSGVAERRIRRALIALVANSSEQVVAQFGARTLDALYRGMFIDESMPDDDFAGLRRLVPFMTVDHLAALLGAKEVRAAPDLIAVARRATAIDAPELWQRALARVSADEAVVRQLAERVTDLTPDEARALHASTLEALTPAIQAPAEWLDEVVTGFSWDPSARELEVETADGDTIVVLIPQDLAELAAELDLTRGTHLVAFRDEDAWEAVSLSNAAGELVTAASPSMRVSPESRDTIFALIDALGSRADVDAGALAPLLDLNYTRTDDEVSGLDLVSKALLRRPGEPAELAARIVVAAQSVNGRLAQSRSDNQPIDGRAALASAVLRLVAAAMKLPAPDVRANSEGLVGVSVGVLADASPETREEISTALRVARLRFKRRAIFTLITNLLPPTRVQRRLIIATIVEPIDAAEAITLYMGEMRKAAAALTTSEDEPLKRNLTVQLASYLTVIEAALQDDAKASHLLSELPLVARGAYAGPTMQLVVKSGAELTPGVGFLRSAASHSSPSLEATARFLMRRKMSSDDDLNALLLGVGRAARRGEQLPKAVVEYQRSLQARVPRLEQFARIAGLIDWEAAEAAGGEKLLDELLVSAEKLLRSDLARAETRMSLAEPWGTATYARRRDGAKGYAKLFSTVRDEAQLLSVVDSLHRFFSREATPERATLRKATYEALTRVYRKRKIRLEVAEHLNEKLSALELLGSASQPAPARVRKLLGM